MTQFCLQRNRLDREQLAVINSSYDLGVGYIESLKALPDRIPVGSVEFCEPVFGEQPTVKKFYPPFLKPWVKRRISFSFGSITIERDKFVKCATEWKADTPARIRERGYYLWSGLWYLSDVVNFEQEWRYYVACGEIITTGWYAGKDFDEPAPQLHVHWPKGFSGAVDFGRTDKGQVELVEAHAPFACGWYGDNAEDYTIWQALAWEHRGYWQSTT